jgi:quercetin dioxygenase-like cupin family protein
MKHIGPGGVRSEPGMAGKFTEGVRQEEMLPAQRDGVRLHRSSYSPSAHSHCRRHDGEHASYAVACAGRIQRRDGHILEVSPGDRVYVTPAEEHWHAAAESLFVHFALTATGSTYWLEVTPADSAELAPAAESGPDSEVTGRQGD